MSAVPISGREPELNRKGHLARFGDWNRDIAQVIAEDLGLKLTDCHWSVIEFLRDYFATHEIPPSPRLVVKSIGQDISTQVPCARKDLDALFPGSGCKQACRIPGLPAYHYG